MLFVDGENLAIRYGKMHKTRKTLGEYPIHYERDVYFWCDVLNTPSGSSANMRKHYYTAITADELKIRDVERKLKDAGIEAPKVFRKKKGQRSKQVDITLATDMLLHATRGNYNIAILVAGDEDYIPLVKAVQGEGARVQVWFLSDGLSDSLRMAADDFVDLDQLLFEP
jgi:hypothetical protein